MRQIKSMPTLIVFGLSDTMLQDVRVGEKSLVLISISKSFGLQFAGLTQGLSDILDIWLHLFSVFSTPVFCVIELDLRVRSACNFRVNALSLLILAPEGREN